MLFVIYYTAVSLPHLFEPSVQELRNHAADVARSRHAEWLANVVLTQTTPPPMHRFASSATCLKPQLLGMGKTSKSIGKGSTAGSTVSEPRGSSTVSDPRGSKGSTDHGSTVSDPRGSI